MKTLVMLLALSAAILADDLYLKNGVIMYNCEVISEDAETVVVRTSDGERSFKAEFIERIERSPFVAAQKTKVVNTRLGEAPRLESGNAFDAALIPVVIIGGTLTWSFFDGIGDQPSREKTKNIVRGSLTAAATLLAFIYISKNQAVKIGATGQSLTAEIRF